MNQIQLLANNDMHTFLLSFISSHVLVLAWGQARFKFGVVMTSHLMLVSRAFFICFIRFYALSCTIIKWLEWNFMIIVIQSNIIYYIQNHEIYARIK